MRTRYSGVCLWIAFVGIAISQQNGPPLIPGSPLPNLTPMELELFRAGLEDFSEVETADEGLGPTFNGTSCAVCHSIPAIGGVSTMTEMRGGYRDEHGEFYSLGGGTLYHLFSTPPHRCQVQIPPEINVIARRAPIAVFGDGLIEAIDDTTIAAQADPDDANGDGISGRAAWLEDIATQTRKVGRFGWKAQQATLLAFSADAYLNEMGITNDLLQSESPLGITPEQLALCRGPGSGLEDVVDRRTGRRGIDNFANFMRLLAPVSRGSIDDHVRAGEALFREVGCTSCHTPVLVTGRNANPLFNEKPVNLFSDLLLHDVGTGDGIPQAAAQADEIRTPPLWGLRFRKPLMHDGATATLQEAVARHAGEAARVTERYHGLDDEKRAALVAFLNSL